jgi:hypothetical protein
MPDLCVQPGGFCGGHLPAECGELVIPPSLIVEFGIGAFVEFHDEALIEQARERAIERAGSEHLSRSIADVGEDLIAVTIGGRERDQNLEDH